MRRLAICVAVLCMTGVAFADEAGNQDAAKRDAAESLALLRLPDGAVRVDENPARDPQYLDTPHSASPNVVAQSEFWRVPGNPWDVFSWLKKHPPAGTYVGGTGGGGNRDGMQVWNVSFARAGIREVMDSRELSVTLAKATGGGTAVRADGVAIWIVPRPASEQIPTGATTVQVSVRGMQAKPVTRFSVSEPARIATVTRLLNRLPLVQPGVRMCPMDRGIRMRLVFRARDHARLADADGALGGCAAVKLSIGGVRQPELEGFGVFADLEAALGRTIDLTPFMGSDFMEPPFPVAGVAHGKFAGVPFDAVAYNGGPRSGVCVDLFLAGVERGTNCLLHVRGKRTSTFPAIACYPRPLTAVIALGRNAPKAPVRFSDGKTIRPAFHSLPHSRVTTGIGLQDGRIVKLKRRSTVDLGYRGPFGLGFRRGMHDLGFPWPLVDQC